MLKTSVIAQLRKSGFKGSFPHFRRITEDRIDLLSFQFSQWGGQFCINVGVAPLNKIASDKLKKAKADDIFQRIRLGPKDEGERDYWFVFDGDSELPLKQIIELVLNHIRLEAENYWANTSLDEIVVSALIEE